MKSYTLKKIPDLVYQRLKESAAKNGTSINSEMLEILVRFAPPTQAEVQAEIKDMHTVRKQLAKKGPVPTMDQLVEIVRESRR